MAKQIINIGTAANDLTGDTLRASFDKTNQNFDELYYISIDPNNSPISKATLDINYPSAFDGFKVYSNDMAEVYTKIGSEWYSQSITLVV